MEWTAYLFTGANDDAYFIRTNKPASCLRSYAREVSTASQEFSMANKVNLIPVGMSYNPHSTLAGEEAAQAALKQLPRYEAPGWALEVLTEMLDQAPGVSDGDNLSLAVTLGQKQGDIYAPYNEAAYVNRLITGSNPASDRHLYRNLSTASIQEILG